MTVNAFRVRPGRPRAVSLIGTSLLVLVLAACGGATTTSAPPPAAAADGALYPPQPLPQRETVVVGQPYKLETFLAMLLAQEYGEFERENLDVQIETVPPNDGTVLLSQGRLDVVPTGTSAVNFNAVAGGARVRAVMPGSVPLTDSHEGLWLHREVLGDDGVFQPADLRGRTIATLGGPVGVNQAYMWQEFTQLDPAFRIADVAFERFSAADMAVAVVNGAVDGGIMVAPSWEALVDDPCCVDVGFSPPFGSSYYAFGPTLLDERPEVGQAFVRALARTTAAYLQGDYHADPRLAADTARVLDSTLERIQAEPAPTFSLNFPMPVEMNGISQEYLFEIGDVLSYPTALTAEQMFDTRFVDALRAG